MISLEKRKVICFEEQKLLCISATDKMKRDYLLGSKCKLISYELELLFPIPSASLVLQREMFFGSQCQE